MFPHVHPDGLRDVEAVIEGDRAGDTGRRVVGDGDVGVVDVRAHHLIGGVCEDVILRPAAAARTERGQRCCTEKEPGSR